MPWKALPLNWVNGMRCGQQAQYRLAECNGPKKPLRGLALTLQTMMMIATAEHHDE